MTLTEGERDTGRIVAGSSDSRSRVFVDNLEFNVELKTPFDYEFVNKFNELWADAVEVSKTYVDTIELQSLFAHFIRTLSEMPIRVFQERVKL